MSAIALVMVAVTATLMLAALSPAATDLQPSAQRVLVTSVIALIAPLFWPGKAKTPERTALTIIAWSGAVTLLAVTTLLLHRASDQSLTLIVMPCMMLLLIMLVTHAVTAGLEQFMNAQSADSDVARGSAGFLASVGLAILGSLPLWLGPAAELAGESSAALIDSVIGVSPLTHLAVASGNDLLRNQWFYQHSNLAALRYSYPGMTTVMAAYIAITLLLIPLAVRLKGRATFLQPTTERFK